MAEWATSEISAVLLGVVIPVVVYAIRFYADRRATIKQHEIAVLELKTLRADGRLTVAVKPAQEARGPRSGYESGLYDWLLDPPEVKQ